MAAAKAKTKTKTEADQEGNGAWGRWCIMGKLEEEQRLSSIVSSEVVVEAVAAPISSLSFRFAACGSKKTLFGLRCFLVLLFSLALFLSALFWLPPFLNFSDQSDLDLDSRFKGSFAFSVPYFLSLFYFKKKYAWIWDFVFTFYLLLGGFYFLIFFGCCSEYVKRK